MPTGAVIGSLRVVLGADTAALEKGLKDAQGSLADFARGASQIAAGIGLEKIIENAVSSFVNSIKHAVTAAGELGKAAEKLGIPVEELSVLKLAAERADVSFQDLSKAVVGLDQNMAKAAAGGTNAFARALAAMGISVKDSEGNLKTQVQLIGEIADKFQGYNDGALKSALATNLFGKAGDNLIPFLNQGSEGIRKAREEAEKFGLIVDGKASAASRQFTDNMQQLSTIHQAFYVQVANQILPKLAELSKSFLDASTDAGRMKEAVDLTSSGIEFFIGELQKAIIEVPAFVKQLIALFNVQKAVFTFGDIQAAMKEQEGVFITQNALVESLTAKFNEFAISAELLGIKLKGVGDAAAKSDPPVTQLGNSAKNALQSFLDATNKATAAQQAAIQTFGATAGVVAKQRVELEAQAIAATNAGISFDQYRAKIDAAGTAAAAAADKLQAKQLLQGGLTQFEQYQKQLETIRSLYASGALGADEFARANEDAAKRFGQGWEAVGGSIANIAGSFASLTKTLGAHNKAAGIASKAFGIAQVIINTQIAAMKALAELGPVAGPFAAAAAVAAGAASIATIASQSFAQGGSFMVPGGASANDNMMMPLALASGERVDVTPAGEATKGANVINIDMRGDQGFYSRANVETMLNAMHTVLADGHQARIVVLK
jgi:hypothetical protein